MWPCSWRRWSRTRTLESDKPVKVALYSLLCKLWGSLKVNQRADAHGPRWEATAQSRWPRSRQSHARPFC